MTETPTPPTAHIHPSKEVVDVVEEDGEQQIRACDVPAFKMIPEARMRELAKGFHPNDQQMRIALLYVQVPPSTSFRSIFRQAGVNENTGHTWLQRPGFKAWLEAVAMECGGRGTHLMWQRIFERGLDKSPRDAHMYALRFDPVYAALVAKSGPVPTASKPSKQQVDKAMAHIRTRKQQHKENL